MPVNKTPEVFVVTKFVPFGVNEYLFTATSQAAAERELRRRFPKLWVDKATGQLQLDKEGTYLFAIDAETPVS